MNASASSSAVFDDRFADADRLSRVDAPGDRRLDRRGVELDAIVVRGVGIGRDRPPPLDGTIERLALRREAAALQKRERRLVRVDVADARAAFDRHVADRHALFDRHPIDRRAAVLVREADAALHAEAADDRQDHVLRVHAGAKLAVDVDAPNLQRIEREALRREHVAHLRGADAEGDGAERAVRRRVAVAAGDRHARLGEAELAGRSRARCPGIRRHRRRARRAGCRTPGSSARAPSSFLRR